VQAGLSWWKEVSPFAGYGATMALAFVLLAAAVKAIVEDRKRHTEDRKTNNSTSLIMEKDPESALPAAWGTAQHKAVYIAQRSAADCLQPGQAAVTKHVSCMPSRTIAACMLS
jgi:hypothetical protein